MFPAVVCDLCVCVCVHSWPSLCPVVQDRSLADVYSCEYVIDGQQLGYVGQWMYAKLVCEREMVVSAPFALFTASDSDKNVVLFQYLPDCEA